LKPRVLLRTLLHLEDTPHRTALAFGIGIWIAFCPLWGIHTAMALLTAFLFRLNRPALLFGAWINNPWTVAPLYTTGTAIGCALLHCRCAVLRVDWSQHGFRGLLSGLRPLLWPFVLGNTLLGVLAGAVAYLLLRAYLERNRHSAGAVPGT